MRWRSAGGGSRACEPETLSPSCSASPPGPGGGGSCPATGHGQGARTSAIGAVALGACVARWGDRRWSEERACLVARRGGWEGARGGAGRESGSALLATTTMRGPPGLIRKRSGSGKRRQCQTGCRGACKCARRAAPQGALACGRVLASCASAPPLPPPLTVTVGMPSTPSWWVLTYISGGARVAPKVGASRAVGARGEGVRARGKGRPRGARGTRARGGGGGGGFSGGAHGG